MKTADQTRDVSIRYTVTLEDGTLLSHLADGDRLEYTRGAGQILAALEEALKEATKGEKMRIVLAPEHDPGLKLDVTRLALLLGHPGKTLILAVEVL